MPIEVATLMAAQCFKRRFLLRYPNREPHHPAEHADLLRVFRSRVSGKAGTLANLRVTALAIEFDLFLPEGEALDPYLDAWTSWGDPLTVRDLSIPGSADPAAAFAQARRLWNEQRFWEVHETLEEPWKVMTGDPKRWTQGVILAAAAGVHIQKHEPAPVPSLLQDARARLEGAPADFYGWNFGRFIPWLDTALQAETLIFPTM